MRARREWHVDVAGREHLVAPAFRHLDTVDDQRVRLFGAHRESAGSGGERLAAGPTSGELIRADAGSGAAAVVVVVVVVAAGAVLVQVVVVVEVVVVVAVVVGATIEVTPRCRRTSRHGRTREVEAGGDTATLQSRRPTSGRPRTAAASHSTGLAMRVADRRFGERLDPPQSSTSS